MNEAAPRPSLAGAVAWMVGAVVSLTAMALAGRELSAEVSIFEIMFFRNAICLAIIVVLVAWHGRALLRTRRLAQHGFRNVVHFGAQFGWFYGLAFLPLAEVFSIEFTAPLWTAILAALFISERLTALRVGGILLGFLGILIILKPGIQIIHPAAFAVLGAAIGFAITFVITKSMIVDERPLTILFYMNLIQLPLGLVPALFLWVTPSPHLWPWALVAGLSGLGTHYCFARAFQLADASIVAPIDFVRLPLVAVVGFLVYDEAIDAFVYLGAAVIFVGNFMNLRGARRTGG